MGSAKLPEKISERIDSENFSQYEPIDGKHSNSGIIELKREISKLKSENDKLRREINDLMNGAEISLLQEKIRHMALLLKSPKNSKIKNNQETSPRARISVIKANAIRKIMKKKGGDLRTSKKVKPKKQPSG